MSTSYFVKPVLLLTALTLLAGCNSLPSLDGVLPDKRKEYRASRSLPELEVPPDLTSASISDNMGIPGEEDSNVLSQYQRRESGGGLAVVAQADEAVVTVSGERFAAWPKLREFWQENGYTLELDDVELGVLETDWSSPRSSEGTNVRDKFNIFAEPGNADNTMFIITHMQQQQTDIGGGESQWVDVGNDEAIERQVAQQLGEHYGLSPASTTTAGSTSASRQSSIQRAEIINNEAGQVYLNLPHGYEQAWEYSDRALGQSALTVRNKNTEQGYYEVVYTPAPETEEKGFFSRLKFWGGDPEPQIYRLAMTDTGDSTEMIVTDLEGEWLSGDDARMVLGLVQMQYNRRR